MSLQSNLPVTLIGTPNVGKTSLFNCLTGQQKFVGNWDGVTLDIASGSFDYAGSKISVKDLPGCYSLVASAKISPEEKIVCEYFTNPKQDLFINVISNKDLTRDLYLTLQLIEQQCNLIIVFNLNNANKDINFLERQLFFANKLSELLKHPVICCDAISKYGITELQQAIGNKLQTNIKASSELLSNYIEPSVYQELVALTKSQQLDSIGALIRFLEGDVLIQNKLATIDTILSAINLATNNLHNHSWDIFFASSRHKFINRVLSCQQVKLNNHHQTDNILVKKLDQIVLHKYFGIPAFCIIIYAMFFCVTEVGNMLQVYLDLGINNANLMVNKFLNYINIPMWLINIFNEGLLVGVSTLLNFIPILLIMHFCLLILEHSGYIARAVFLIDRLMGWLGLSGKALIPMIIGFGCNVPAIMGAKSIGNKRDRIITILMTPFMSCNARLVTYSVFAAAFFPSNQGSIIFCLYVTGILAAMLTGFLLQSFLSGTRSNLIMELPQYAMPPSKLLIKQAINRVKNFLINSGIMIILVCTVIAMLKQWALLSNLILNSNLIKYIILIFKPMGILDNNWPAIAGLASGIVAKESIIASLNSFYTVSGHEMTKILYMQFGNYKAAFAYLLFVLLSLPCVSVIASIYKELNLRWAAFAVAWTTGLAYVISVCYYQLATFAEHPIYSAQVLFSIISIFLMVLLLIKIKFDKIKNIIGIDGQIIPMAID